MNRINFSKTLLLICLCIYSCNLKPKKNVTSSLMTGTLSKPISGSNNKINKKSSSKQLVPDNNFEFEKKMYLKIDKIYSGKIYKNHNGLDVFYRIIEIPEEENILLFAENISIGEESGKYQLIKRICLIDNNSVIPKVDFNNIDSLKFIDSVTVECYFNRKKTDINLNSLKEFNLQ